MTIFDDPNTPDLTTLKKKSLNTIYPHFARGRMCGLMVLTSLVEPEWILIMCHSRLLSHVFCQVNVPDIELQVKQTPEDLFCPLASVVNDSRCYMFNWHAGHFGNNIFKKHHKRTKEDFKTFIRSFKNIFAAVSPPFPPFLNIPKENNKNVVYMVFQRKLLHSMIFQEDSISPTHAEGFVITEEKHIFINLVSLITVVCAKTEELISILLLCDGIYDCFSDISDEDYCICNHSSPTYCRETWQAKKRKCSELYYMIVDGFCKKYVGTRQEWGCTEDFVLCSISGRNISQKLQNDLFPDCGSSAEDEPVLGAVLKLGMQIPCENPGEIPCKEGHSKCFNVFDICSYTYDSHGNLYPCRNGAHLENCEAASCNVKYKCSYSYCVSWVYTCDGQWHCPDGDDEAVDVLCDGNTRCRDMYKCKDSSQCVHLANICDTKLDCPLKDDEHLCDLRKLECPERCTCLVYAIKCVSYFPFVLPISYPFELVSLSETCLPSIQEVLDKVPNVVMLRIVSQCATRVCNTVLFKKLHILEITANNIHTITENCFVNSVSMKILKLVFNNLTLVEARAFANLTGLQILNLTGNPLATFSNSFLVNSSIFVLILVRVGKVSVPIDKISLQLNISYWITDDFHLCCIGSGMSICLTEKPWYMSCSSLLAEMSLVVAYVVVSCLIVICNILSISLLSQEHNKGFAHAIASINCCNLLCAFYLVVVWSSHFRYTVAFPFVEESWRSSVLCFIAMGTILLFVLLTQLTLLFLSLLRLMVTIHPITSSFMKVNFVRKALSVIGTLSSVTAFSVTVLFALEVGQSPTSLCTPFTDLSQEVVIAQVLTWFTAHSQFLASMAIVVKSIMLVWKVKKSRQKVSSETKSHTSTSALITQLSLISISTVLCWFSSKLIDVLAMLINRIPLSMIFWSLVAFLPLNSLVHPIIFSVTFVRKCLKKKGKLP